MITLSLGEGSFLVDKINKNNIGATLSCGKYKDMRTQISLNLAGEGRYRVQLIAYLNGGE
ncbi:hypothetical protein SJ435_11745 [Serratia marcescens]|uniref:Uncharacterized protein n=1 Tax=Serratia marcescens TaxID=615 RepID=A0ABD5IG72_SERMA|nr:hypothetical protein [Serratia marcescens]GJK52000.1 hypothetical protein TUM17560_43770 [Serratia marcescens]